MKYMITALPRSGTTWAANWLTCDGSICVHDPLAKMRLEEIAAIHDRDGISCTAMWMFPASYPCCPTVILEQPISRVNASLRQAGLPEMPDYVLRLFNAAPGVRFPYEALFTERGAMSIWRILRPNEPFNFYRWRELARMKIETANPYEFDPCIAKHNMAQFRGW